MNIPIYRAKMIDSDEYVEGYLSNEVVYHYHKAEIGEFVPYDEYIRIKHEYGDEFYRIDKSTLSIHFPDMLDSEGNKIFASLSDDGKGGDIVDLGYNYLVFTMKLGKSLFSYSFKKSKIIRIQK